MKASTACFTGHRPSKFSFGYDENHPDCQRLKDMLRAAIEDSTEAGYRHFISGMALGVDTWAAQAVLDLRDAGAPVTLEAAIPCRNQERRWRQTSQDIYNDILARADVRTLVNDRPYAPYLMIARDKYMVDASSRLIAVYDGTAGGTRHTYDYARKQKIVIVRIDPVTMCHSVENLPSAADDAAQLF
jgi:uncharacterized phage-like protein YoqJ